MSLSMDAFFAALQRPPVFLSAHVCPSHEYTNINTSIHIYRNARLWCVLVSDCCCYVYTHNWMHDIDINGWIDGSRRVYR